MVTGWVHLILNVCNCKKTVDCKKETSTSADSREIPLIRKTGWGTAERGGRMQCFMKKEDKSLLDVENV